MTASGLALADRLDGKREGKGSFASAALLGYDSDHMHGWPLNRL